MSAAQPEHPATIAAIDIGTNSVHGIVARVTGGGDAPRFDVLDREKTVVRLGSSGDDMRELDAAAIDRAIAALSQLRQVAEAHGASVVRAVATSAAREADNRDVLLRRARAEAGIEVEIISGTEEARLIYLGVLQAVPVYERRILLCDIGGGSTELLVGQRGEVVASRSLKLGAIRLTERFFRTDQLHPGAVDACRRFVRSTLAPVVRELGPLRPELAVGSSGTIVALAEMAARCDGHEVTGRQGTLRRDALDRVVTALLAAPTVAARARLPGLDARRAEIILGGALTLEAVMHELDVAQLTVSDGALREGVLLDTWRRHRGGDLHHLSDLRRRSVLALRDAMDEDPAHAAQVARLALELFDATRTHHRLDGAARETLEAAALLCNIGLFLSHAAHHKHSAYLIRHTDRLVGFTDHELTRISLVARYHRKSEPKAKHPEWAALDADDQRAVCWLAGLLRVAIGLDRSHAARVAAVEVTERDGHLEVLATPQGGADIGLEVYAATMRKGLLEAALGRPVEVRQRPVSGSTP